MLDAILGALSSWPPNSLSGPLTSSTSRENKKRHLHFLPLRRCPVLQYCCRILIAALKVSTLPTTIYLNTEFEILKSLYYIRLTVSIFHSLYSIFLINSLTCALSKAKPRILCCKFSASKHDALLLRNTIIA